MRVYKTVALSSSSSSTSPRRGKSQKPEDRPIYDVTEGIASPETKRKYAYHFQSFLNHFDGLTVQSLIEKDKRTIEAMIIKWIHYLSTERKQKNGTIHHEVAAVLHWCDFNDISINKKRINSAIPEDEEIREDRCYDLKEIEQVLSKCDERGRVIVLLMTSTGMRIGALPTLKFGDLQEVIHGDVNSNRKLYKIQVYGRTRHKYYTFCTSIERLEKYLVKPSKKNLHLSGNCLILKQDIPRPDLSQCVSKVCNHI